MWRLSPVRRAAVQRRAAREKLPDVALSLAAIYGVFLPVPLIRTPTMAGGILVAVTAAALVIVLALRAAALRGRIPRRWAHTALGLALATLVVRGVVGWMVRGEGDQITMLALIVMAVGFLSVSAAWTYALIALVEVGWLAILVFRGLPWPPHYLPLLLVGAAPVAIVVRQVRIEALWRDQKHRRGERHREAQLHAAMARASESERRFRGIFERIQDVYLRVGLDGRIEMISPSVTRFGFQPHELIGTDARECFARGDVERGAGLIVAGGPVGDIELRWRRRDGSEIVVSAAASVVRDASGAPIAYEAVLRDISERKRLEAERREQQAELAHVLRLSSMGEMAAEMAHELTQPLAAIVNYAGACARYVRGGRDEKDRLLQGLELIAAQGLRAGEIVRRMRSFVAKRPPQRELADVATLVEHAVHTVGGEAQRLRIPIVVQGGGPWRASVDAIQIEQVIVNLLLNALEAVPAPAEGDRIAVTVSEGIDGTIEVAVSDPGCGLGALATRVFDPFFSTKPSGLGMGLAISRSIVESHGGRLWATPNPDRGTTFHFTLPRSGTPAEAESEPAATVH